jgi:hypothetical protein
MPMSIRMEAKVERFRYPDAAVRAGSERCPVARVPDGLRGGWGSRAGHRMALALALMVTIGCSNRVAGDKAPPSPEDDGTRAGASRLESPAEKKAAMSDTRRDSKLIQKHYAKVFKVSTGDIEVTIMDDVHVPGITVFYMVADPARAGRHIYRGGIVAEGAIYTEGEAMNRVARAWSYDARRPVSATVFAEVMGHLHSADHGSGAILDAGTLDAFKRRTSPAWAAAAQLPTETIVDGLPAVTYCITSAARTIPFSVVTAVVKPDFEVELRVQPILNE